MADHVVVSIKSRPDVPLSLSRPIQHTALVSHLYRLHQQKKMLIYECSRVTAAADFLC
jgi:hypothetical protein